MEKKLFKKKFKNDSHHKEKIKSFPDSKNITIVLCNIWWLLYVLFLVPLNAYTCVFSSDACGNYTNCLACMMDASCGWCPSSGQCARRQAGASNSSAWCGPDKDTLLITHPRECYTCPDYIDCVTCSQVFFVGQGWGWGRSKSIMLHVCHIDY